MPRERGTKDWTVSFISADMALSKEEQLGVKFSKLTTNDSLCKSKYVGQIQTSTLSADTLRLRTQFPENQHICYF